MRPTVCVTCAGADGGTPSDEKKAEAEKMLEKRDDSPASSARFVGRTHGTPTHLIDKEQQNHLENILPTIKTFAITKKDYDLPEHLPCKFSIQ